VFVDTRKPIILPWQPPLIASLVKAVKVNIVIT
jgi:hypothetical protein